MKRLAVLLVAALSLPARAEDAGQPSIAQCHAEIEALKADVAKLRQELAALKATLAGTAATVASVSNAAAGAADALDDAMQSVLALQVLANREPVPPADFNQALSTAQAKVGAIAGVPRSRALKEILGLYAEIGAIEDASINPGLAMSQSMYDEIMKRFAGACADDFRAGRNRVSVRKFPTACEVFLAQQADLRISAFQTATP